MIGTRSQKLWLSTMIAVVAVALYWCVAFAAEAHELPMFGRLPPLNKNWILCDGGTNSTSMSASSWIVLTNSQNGDVLSFYEERHGNKPFPKPVNQGAWTEMAISLLPGGYPAWKQPPGLRIKASSWGRNGLVNLSYGEVAVDSTTIWEEESGTNWLAHGYALALGELKLYVQHTSKNIIGSEIAQNIADELIILYASRAKTNTSPALYVHFGLQASDSTQRLLSGKIRLGELIFLAGENYWKLTGKVERRGTEMIADLRGDIGPQSQFYKGTMALEKPVFGQGGAASGGVIPMWFALSTNSDSKPILERLKEMEKQRLEKIR